MSEIDYIRDTNANVIAQTSDGGEVTSQTVEANLLFDILYLLRHVKVEKPKVSKGSVIADGTLYQNVTFVKNKDQADLEVLYDRVELDYGTGTMIYTYHGHIVATTKIKTEK